MSQKYIAWNGEEYPWPPPPDWYEATDGRWWAPNSGPGPKAANEAASETAFPSEAETQFSAPQITSDGFTQEQPQQPQFDNTPNPTPISETRHLATQQPLQYGADPDPFNSFAQTNDDGGRSKLPVVLAGVAALAVLLGAGIFAITRGAGDDTTASAETSTTTDLSTTTTVAQTTTTVEPTTTTESVDPVVALDGFRSYAVDINIVGLTDEDLNQIGEEACTAAVASETTAEWDLWLTTVTNEIIAEQTVNPPAEGDPLTADLIRSIYNGGAIHYCPGQAQQLGIAV